MFFKGYNILFLYCFKAVCVFWTNLLPFWIKDKMFMIAGKMGMRPVVLKSIAAKRCKASAQVFNERQAKG
jgi:hypothetical protein